MTSYISKQKKFCCKKCVRDHQKSLRLRRDCKLCGKTFVVVQKKVRFCCHRCSVIYYLKYGNRQSKPEKRIAEILSELGITHVQSFHLENKVYDFFIPSRNLLLEVDGVYWHGRDKSNLNDLQRKNIQNDEFKNKLAKKRGYDMLRICEDEVENVSKYFC